MAFLTTAGLVLSAGSSINQFIQGNKIAKAAERELDNFQYQELTNLAERLKPSLEAERQLRVQTSEMLSTATDVAQGRDIAGALGILGMGYQQAQKSQLQGLTSMLEKEYQADLEVVRDEQAMRQMRETRDMERLQSLKAQAMAGKEMQVDALTGLATTAVSAGLSQEAMDAQAGIDAKTKNAFNDARDAANAVKTVSDTVDVVKSTTNKSLFDPNYVNPLTAQRSNVDLTKTFPESLSFQAPDLGIPNPAPYNFNSTSIQYGGAFFDQLPGPTVRSLTTQPPRYSSGFSPITRF